MGFTKHICHLIICIHQSCLSIRQEKNDICHLDGHLCLLPHMLQHQIIGLRFNTSGIHQRKAVIQPGHVRIDPVSGNTWCILDDGDPFSHHHIKQCGFAHIGTSHDCYDWFCHFMQSPFPKITSLRHYLPDKTSPSYITDHP